MGASNITLAVVSVLLAGLLFHPRLVRAPLWQATVTPLASIIGSGFLVAGPILAHVAGVWAWAAMLGLCAAGFLYGEVIRHNIAVIEPRLRESPGRTVRTIEGLSDLALSLAYFVSVAYYLTLFAAFGLRFAEVMDPFWIRVVATTAIAAIGVVGFFGGLDGLEWLEVGAVGLKLSVIGGLCATLGVVSVLAVQAGTFAWPALHHPGGWYELRVLLGLVILVQGFETSRYLGQAYDAETRIRTMRWAQLISSAIYLAFVLLITRDFDRRLPEQGGETAIIDMLAPVGTLVAPLLILAALASQFSAAVADTNGAAGLLSETTGRRVKVRLANVATAIVAAGIVWIADIYEIIVWASRMFVAYYGLQALQAMLAAWRMKRRARVALFAAAALLAVAIVIFAIPAAA